MDSLPNVSLGEGNPLLGFLGSIVSEPRLTKGETLAQLFLRLTRMMTLLTPNTGLALYFYDDVSN